MLTCVAALVLALALAGASGLDRSDTAGARLTSVAGQAHDADAPTVLRGESLLRGETGEGRLRVAIFVVVAVVLGLQLDAASRRLVLATVPVAGGIGARRAHHRRGPPHA